MDGVLIDAQTWHYEALNAALGIFGCHIDKGEHHKEFDGLPSRKKLEMLTQRGRIPEHVHSSIERIKQEQTLRIAAMRCKPRIEHLLLFAYLKRHGVRIAVATNSIRRTATAMLTFAGLYDDLSLLLTNEDVTMPKPHPEIYLRSLDLLGVQAEETVVVEDSDYGIKAATEAGCNVVRVSGVDQVSIPLLSSRIEKSDDIAATF